jgi:hypothetical protein
VSSWKKALADLPSSLPRQPRPLEVFVNAWQVNSKAFQAFKDAAKKIGLKWKEIQVDSKQPDSDPMKRARTGEYDAYFMYSGVNDPDPDTMWRYLMKYFNGKTKLISSVELDEALLEPSVTKREELYRAFELKNVADPFLVPIRLLSSTYYIAPALTPPSGGNFEGGLHLWKFSRNR